MITRRMLTAGGILTLLLALFHGTFPWLFGWEEDLQSLSAVNRAIIYTFQVEMIFIMLVFAYLSFARQVDLLTTSLDKVLLLAMAIVWLLRAMAEVVFFQIGAEGAIWRVVLFLLLALLYGLPLYFRRDTLYLSQQP